jgi:hypothetical protein
MMNEDLNNLDNHLINLRKSNMNVKKKRFVFRIYFKKIKKNENLILRKNFERYN